MLSYWLLDYDDGGDGGDGDGDDDGRLSLD